MSIKFQVRDAEPNEIGCTSILSIVIKDESGNETSKVDIAYLINGIWKQKESNGSYVDIPGQK